MNASIKLTALVAVMSALGNVLGLLSLKLPSAPGTTLEFHLSVLPALLLSLSIGPLAGAMTGGLSVVVATMKIGNVFIPFGNALLTWTAGFLAKRFSFPPPVSGVVAMILYSPYVWLASSIYGISDPYITVIIAKAFIEVLISATLVEFILLRPEVKRLLVAFKT